ncbi:MAG: TetR/AcrR family transcriptional regulator, partial [Mycobacterium sp.]|nr:TetR/AcrR family transcriptional regulator [Mycobacterium sp.]
MKTLGTPPTRQTQAPRKRGDDTRARIIDETV